MGAAELRDVLQSQGLVENCVGLYVPLLEFNPSGKLERCPQCLALGLFQHRGAIGASGSRNTGAVSPRTVFERVREALLRHKNHKNREIGFRRDIEVPNEYSYLDKMMSHRFHNQIGKACALAAATLILPVLAHAQTAPTTSTTSTVRPRVPEGGPGAALLITTFGTMLLLSARLSSRKKAQPDPK